jgi:hypothetical protein
LLSGNISISENEAFPQQCRKVSRRDNRLLGLLNDTAAQRATVSNHLSAGA